MKNFLTDKEFLPELKSKGSMTITTDYNRVDKLVPFVNKVVINKLADDCVIEVEKVRGAYQYKVTQVE